MTPSARAARLYAGIAVLFTGVALAALSGPNLFLAGTVVLLAVLLPALAIFTLSRQEERARRAAARSATEASSAPLATKASGNPGIFLGVGSTLGAAILVWAVLLYLGLPRFRFLSDRTSGEPSEQSARNRSKEEEAPASGPESDPWSYRLSGFAREMEIPASARIVPSNRPAFFVRLVRDEFAFRASEALLYWRGRTLSLYEGGVWREPGADLPLDAAPDGWVALPEAPELFKHLESERDIEILQEVEIAPTGERTLFALAEPVAIEGERILYGPARSIALLRRPTRGAACRIVSRLHLAGPPVLARATLAEAGPVHLRLPEEDPDLAELARGIVEEHRTDYARVEAIASWLRENGRYSLAYSLPPGRDPVRSFLMGLRTGHCELFSASMAVLLRHARIPCRIAVGFRGGSWDEFRQGYSVHERDAHAWVEVPFVGHGWVRFDPTPGGDVGPASAMDLEVAGTPPPPPEPAAVEEPATQDEDVERASGEEERASPERPWYEDLAEYDRDAQRRLIGRILGPLGTRGVRIGYALAALAGLLVLLTLAARLAARLGARPRVPARAVRNDPALAESLPVLASYDRTLAALSRYLKRRRSETPREFARRASALAPPGVPGPLDTLTGLFELVRYGACPVGPGDVERARAASRQIEEALARAGRHPPG